MITKDMKKIIEENVVALATADNDNPNVIPVACVKIKDNKICVTDSYMSYTKEIIQKNPFVCLAVWNKDIKGFKIIGKAKYYTSGKYFELIKAMKENKGYPAKGAIVIEIKKIIKLGKKC